MPDRGRGRAASISERAEISDGLQRLGLASHEPKRAATTSMRNVMAEERNRIGIASHAPAHMRRMQEQRHSPRQPVEKHETRRAAGGAAPRGRTSHSPLLPLEMRETRLTQERRVAFLQAREASLDRQVQTGVRRLKELSKSLTQTDQLEAAEDAIEELEREVAITTWDVEELLARIRILALERGELEAAMGVVVDRAPSPEAASTSAEHGAWRSPELLDATAADQDRCYMARGDASPLPSSRSRRGSLHENASPFPSRRSRRGSLDGTAALRALSAFPACAVSSSQEGGGSGPEGAEAAQRHDDSLSSPLRVSMLGAASACPIQCSLQHSLGSSLEVYIYIYIYIYSFIYTYKYRRSQALFVLPGAQIWLVCATTILEPRGTMHPDTAPPPPAHKAACSRTS